ncbi:SDR family NAD(P)-dependent oxidoreductase [Marinibaculum pumilum]|uniref:SDR family NAD(P)-dependent oxidoreductase n=1 Tax=Marinibaculum pumilum TaxID=1766165 RepID=A0ABV7L1Q1_9PROT
MSVKDKVAIVTGGGTGLGAAVSTRLAAEGARVAVNYSRSAADAEACCTAIGHAGGEAVAIQADVASDADCRRLAAEALERWGRIDILVNNAGITRFADQADLDALDAEDFVDIYRVNVVGAYQMVRACAPAMRAAGKGAVVNISSIAGVTGIGSSMAYAASKGALNTMTLSLARSLAPEIRVNAVCPGFIGTRWFADELGPERYAARVKQQEETTLLRRAGRPEDIAVVVLFFCGEGSDHITGETLMPDAGLHLGFAPHVAR